MRKFKQKYLENTIHKKWQLEEQRLTAKICGKD